MKNPISKLATINQTGWHSSWAVTVLLLLMPTTPLRAQLYYGRIDNNGGETLRQINADGNGDAAFPLPFPKVLTPTWSRDGRVLAVTAVDPARPSQITLNAWTYDPATGAKLKVTNFHDNSANTFSITFALYKAFSANRATMAVNSFIRSGGDEAHTTTTPILQLFPTNGDPGPIATLHVGYFRDEVHHDGEGVDWSPTQNMIVAPFKWDAPLQSGTTNIYGPAEATALFLINPTTGASQQLTVPHGDLINNGPFGEVISWAEEDYAPKFSPNGQSVAYVRSYQQTTGSSGPDRDVQALRIINVTTRQDQLVLQLQKGLYVTSLDWSPDGTQLVFDLGQQASVGGFPVQQAQALTDGISVVNVSGSNPHALVGQGAATPAWRSMTTPPSPSALTNISTRLQVLADPNELITGVIIHGTTPKQVLFRGLGPTLAGAPFNIPGALTDSTLELHTTDAQGHDHLIASNDNWKTSQQAAIVATGKAPPKDAEAAILQTLSPGNYTVIMRGKNGGTGIGLLDAYDLTPSNTSQLFDISSRGFVGTDPNAMIGGFIVGKSANFVVRNLGPTLGQFGVTGFLADPTLELRDANGALIAGNDDWQQDANKSHLGNLAPPNPKESALYRTLTPGNYSVIVRGKSNTTGVALVEVYNVP